MKPVGRRLMILFVLGYIALGAMPLRAEWVQGGVNLCTTIYNKKNCQIVSDGAGGGIIAWSEYRSGSWQLYAQRIDASGGIQWGSQGITLSAIPSTQDVVRMISDGTGGAIIAWQDNRSGQYHIYAQRVDGSGASVWNANGVAVCTTAGVQYLYGIASDNSGGALIVWLDSAGNWDIYAQRIDPNGNAIWTANGVAVSASAALDGSPQIASDGTHGAIVVFTRNVSGNSDLFANRVDAGGTVRWAADGVALCTAMGGESDLRVAYDGAGGAIVAFGDYRNFPEDIYAQRIDTSGAVQWTATGKAVCAVAGEQAYPQLVSDGAGGAIIVWKDSRSGTSDIYAQRIDGSGTSLWTTNGVPVCVAVDAQDQPQIASDGSGGALIVWRDLREGSGNYNIYAQRIDAGGASVWVSDGIAVCGETGVQQNPAVAYDGYGGGLFAWQDHRGGGDDIYAHRENPIVATLLESFSTEVEAACVELSWVLSAAGVDVGFSIQRAVGSDCEFEEIMNPEVKRNGLSFSFTDCECEPGDAVRYRVAVNGGDGRTELFETGALVLPPMQPELFQNHPNPFNPSTTIKYYLPETEHVALGIYDSAGRKIAVIVDGVQTKGSHEVEWNGKDGVGRVVGSGVYFCRLVTGKTTFSRKIVLLK